MGRVPGWCVQGCCGGGRCCQQDVCSCSSSCSPEGVCNLHRRECRLEQDAGCPGHHCCAALFEFAHHVGLLQAVWRQPLLHLGMHGLLPASCWGTAPSCSSMLARVAAVRIVASAVASSLVICCCGGTSSGRTSWPVVICCWPWKTLGWSSLSLGNGWVLLAVGMGNGLVSGACGSGSVSLRLLHLVCVWTVEDPGFSARACAWLPWCCCLSWWRH